MKSLRERLAGIPEWEQEDVLFDYIGELEAKLQKYENKEILKEESDIIEGMCMTYRHDFGLLDSNTQENIRIQMKQLYLHNVKDYVDSLKKG